MKKIDGVPDHITTDQHKTLLAALTEVGLDTNHLRSVAIHGDGLHAEVMARDPDGHRELNKLRNEVATHQVWIPVRDATPPAPGDNAA